MRAEYRFTCALRHGLHARPASMLADVARRFAAAVTLAKSGAPDGAPPPPPVDARSVLSVVGLDVKLGDACIVEARGPDAPAAIAALRQFIEHGLADADEVPPRPCDAGPAGAAARLPIGLRRLGTAHVSGRAVCGGIAQGVAVPVHGLALPAEARDAKPASVDEELAAATGAIAAVREDLRHRGAAAGGGGPAGRIESDLLRAHAGIADDPALWSEVEQRVRSGATAAQAVAGAAERFADHLRTAASAYIRDRAVDVQDVCAQIVDRLLGGALGSRGIALVDDSVVFADVLTANQLLGVSGGSGESGEGGAGGGSAGTGREGRGRLRGLVLGHVGATSHTVILARSLGIPTLIDVPDAGTVVGAGTRVIVDGGGGFVVTEVNPPVERYYQRERRTQQKREQRLEPLTRRPAVTADGARLEIGANASTADEVAAGVAGGADGVGLLRTELLFLDRASAPTEDEQFQAYAAVVRAAGGRPVIIRTFDIGGDKPAKYLPMAKEDNPFLGVRGLRLYERHPRLLRTQLRAILRASAAEASCPKGSVKVMAPMVATPAEAAWFRAQVRQAQDELRRALTPFDEGMPIGIMVEIPAAAMVMDQLCAEVDFFSIGTNDLCQYWMAVDRGNAGVAGLYNPRQPSFLRLLRTIVDGARAHGKWIGVCGEMAGDRLNLPLMLGLGVDEISVAPGEVRGLKMGVADADAARCRELLPAAAACGRVTEVDDLLAAGSWRSAVAGAQTPVLGTDLIQTASDAASKEEAIKEAVDLLYVAGRTQRPRDVEEAVWAREALDTTGFGYGFAVAHCKSDAVLAPTLAVLKLSGAGVDWQSMDGLPVRVVMLLVVPATDTSGGGGAHMKVFAKLARKLMHEEFRDRMLGAGNAEAVHACLKEELEIG
jgi:phosphoenolpyruvate-protein phosphotransferase